MKSLAFALTLVMLLVIGGLAGYMFILRPQMSPVAPIANPDITPTVENVDDEPLAVLQEFQLTSPQRDQVVQSPLEISGQAQGSWFFEATFPVILIDSEGTTLAEGFATAQGDWMTEQLVPFTARLEFTQPTTGDRGSLVLQKANPSDLPENADSFEIPVRFSN